MIQKLQQAFHSLAKSLEVLYVIEGAKPCARTLVHEDELQKTLDFLEELGLSHSVSGFKVRKQPLQSDFYSDKSVKIQKNDPRKGYYFVYLSRTKETSDKAKIAEEKGLHFELGTVLGYPKCCCDFFEKNFDENNTDLTLKTLKYSAGTEFPFYNNIAARHFDMALLSHFPHSFGCSPSIEIAKSNLGVIKKFSNQLAIMISGVLRGVSVYTAEEGIFIMRNYEKNNDEIIYSNVLGTAKSKLYFLLNSNNRLKIIDKNYFAVNGVHITGDKFGIMVFD